MKKLYSVGRNLSRAIAVTSVLGFFSLFICAGAPAQGCAVPSFGSAVNYAAGSQQTNSVTLGDLNGDGKTDMVVTYYYNVLVYFNNGSGSYGTPVSYTAGNDPIYALIRDLNGDGRPDLVVANEGAGNNVSVLFNNGSGVFGSATNYAVGSNPYSVKAGDLNGDSKPDLVVVNHGSNNLSVLFNNGSGGFGTAVTYPVGSGPQDVVIRDLNGDGKADLAVSNQYANNVSVFFNNGSGGFGAATNYAVGSGPILMDGADLNGDGKPDLAVANSSGNNVSVLFNNGSGGFGAAVNYAAGTGPQAVVIGDVNGDGKADLVATNYNSNNISILTNNGSGGFGSPTNYAVGSGPGMTAIGDINGDRKADLAVTNFSAHTVSVLLNTCNASTYIPLPVQLVSFKAAEENGSVQLEWTVADEQGITQYQVERSLLGDSFQRIGEVSATKKSMYRFLDQLPVIGSSYYRLRIVEANGNYHYSPVIVLRVDGGNQGAIAIYPNPVTNHRFVLQLINQPQGLFTFRLYNNLGQEVLRQRIRHSSGSSVETILLPARFSKGLYSAVVESSNARNQVKVIVQ